MEHILFRDPMFSMQKKRVVAICDEIVRRGLRVTWKCETRMDCLDDETLASMARAGCVGVNFGVESIDPEVQKGVHRKPILVDEFRTKGRAMPQVQHLDVRVFVVGLPGDTLTTVLVRWSSRFTCGRAGRNSVATPFVGTPMHDWAVKLGIITPDFYKIVNAHTISYGNETLRGGDIVSLHRFAHTSRVVESARDPQERSSQRSRLSRCEDDRRRCHA